MLLIASLHSLKLLPLKKNRLRGEEASGWSQAAAEASPLTPSQVPELPSSAAALPGPGLGVPLNPCKRWCVSWTGDFGYQNQGTPGSYKHHFSSNVLTTSWSCLLSGCWIWCQETPSPLQKWPVLPLDTLPHPEADLQVPWEHPGHCAGAHWPRLALPWALERVSTSDPIHSSLRVPTQLPTTTPNPKTTNSYVSLKTEKPTNNLCGNGILKNGL